MRARVLSGLTVLDLTRVMSGPYCTLMLGDMGARVIKVEHPARGDDTRAWGPPFAGGESVYFLSVNRNKESLALDFKDPAGRAVLDRLLAKTDVLVENFQPGTLARLGLDYPALSARWPRLICASISGYGHTGPSSRLPGYDAVSQAEGGLMSLTGDPDGPPFRLGLPITDLGAGLFAALGVLLALIARAETGRGRHVDVSMLDTVAGLLTYQAANCLTAGAEPPRMGNAHASIVPYGTFDVRDGQLMLAVGNDDQWRRFCGVAGLGDLAGDARFASNPQRVANRDALVPLVAGALASRTRAEWTAALRNAGVPCGPVRTVGEMVADPQLEARGMILSLQHAAAGAVRVMGNPVQFSDEPAHPDAPPPRLGEHTDAILAELGMSNDDIDALRRRGVI